jgi:hypothetical protein
MNQMHTYNFSDRNNRVEEIYPAVMESMVCVSCAENNTIVFFVWYIFGLVKGGYSQNTSCAEKMVYSAIETTCFSLY